MKEKEKSDLTIVTFMVAIVLHPVNIMQEKGVSLRFQIGIFYSLRYEISFSYSTFEICDCENLFEIFFLIPWDIEIRQF